MAHPLKSEAADAHSSKLRAMTSHYGLGSGPANNISSPQERLKGEGGEHHVGFGADSDNATSKRGDRAAKRTTSANPIATYARGGKVKGEERCEGGPAKADGGVISRAKGGRAKHKGSTHVNVIVAPQGAGGPPPMAGPNPQLAALAAGAHPPMSGPPPGPPMPPPGAGPGGPPGMLPGGPPMPMRARGGMVMGDHPDAKQDKELIQKTLREEGLVRKAKGGGIHMTAGAVTGEGRLEKMGITARHRGSMKPQEV